MIARKNKGKYFNNILGNRKTLFRNYEDWLNKMWIRLITVILISASIFLIKALKFDAPKNAINFLKEKLEYSYGMEDYIANIKGIPEYIKRLGNKTIEAMKTEDKLAERFIMPIDGEIITYFNEAIGSTEYKANGMIFASEIGTNIYSVDDGVVIEVGSNKAIGNYIIIKHKGELLSVYKYLGENNVNMNQSVDRGQKIGTSTERFLLEVWYRNEAIDPIQYMNLSTKQL